MAKVLNRKSLRYTGEIQPKPGEIDSDTGQYIYPYLPDKKLIEAVNLAIYLERPLLVKGEPGCGKTKLAKAISYELDLSFESWYIKSSSRAQDGLYIYDSVGRLRDAQLATTGQAFLNDKPDKFNDPTTYVRWGPLGRAFQNDLPTVMLIDEIDKADIDFPNDLLLELDERRFFIEETGQKVQSRTSPIVIITSNDEKDLPDAFLRRCLFHYIEFPNEEELTEIIKSRFRESSSALIAQAVNRFADLRREMRREAGRTGKGISTSELIDWFTALEQFPEDEALSKLDGELPFLGVLLKNWDDHLRYLRRVSRHE